MDRLILALVHAETPLPTALKSIRVGTRGIVVTRPDGALLVTAGDIMAEGNAVLDAGEDPAIVPVGRVIPRHLLIQAPPLGVGHPVADASLLAKTPLSLEERAHFDAAFDEDRRYAIQHVGSDFAVVVTASERFARELGSSVTICTCAGNPVHTFEQRDLRVPGKCNKPHGVKVTCSSADDTA